MASKDLQPFKESFVKILYHSQFGHKAQFPPASTNLSGKVAIITGGNTGIGFEAGRQFLEFKLSRLIIAVRSVEKGLVASKKLQAEFPTAIIDVFHLDMSSYESIQKFTERVDRELPRLDIAILNAGVQRRDFHIIASTGHEECMQVNYLSSVLLAILLLPILKKKSPVRSPGRLSIVSSGTVYGTGFRNRNELPLLKSFDDPSTAPPPFMDAYGASKLLMHLFVYKLVDLVSPEDVIVNLPDPGMTKGTGLIRDLPWLAKATVVHLLNLVCRTTREGASSYLDASLVKGKETHGCFLMDWQIRPYPPIFYTAEGKSTIETLWKETMAELEFAKVEEILKAMTRR